MQLVDHDGNTVAEGDVGEIQIRGHNVMKGYGTARTPPRTPSTPRLLPDR